MQRWMIAAALGAAVLAPSFYLAWISRDMPGLGSWQDDAIYWVCAKSLAEGSGYRIASLPRQPYQTKYPPLLPWLLAAIQKYQSLFPENLRLARALVWMGVPLLLLATLPLLVQLGLSRGERWSVAALLATNTYVLVYSSIPMTELFGAALVIASCVLAKSAESSRRPLLLALLAGAVAGAAYLMRTAALPLLAAGPLWLLWRRKRAAAAVFLGAAAPAAAGWTAWSNLHRLADPDVIEQFYTSYTGLQWTSFGVRGLLRLAAANAERIYSGIANLLVFAPDRLMWLLTIAVPVAVLAGIVRRGRRSGWHPYHLFAGLSVLVLVGWQVASGDRHERLLVPLLPLFLAGLVAILHDAWRLNAAGKLAAGIVAAAAVWAALAGVMACPAGFEDQRRRLEDTRARCAWISAHLSGDATVLSGSYTVLYLYTGRRGGAFVSAVDRSYSDDEKELRGWVATLPEFARRHHLQYVDLPPGAAGDCRGHGAAYCRALGEIPNILEREAVLVYRSEHGSIYRVP